MKKFIYIIKIYFALFITLIFIFSPVLTVLASTATRERHRELERQLNERRQRVTEQQNLLTGTRHEMSQINAEMLLLDQQLLDANEAIDAIELSILETEIRMEDTQEYLQVVQNEHDAQFEVLKTRIRVMHEQGSVGMIDVLFQAESISDFFLRWEYIRVAAEFDRDLLRRLEQTEQSIMSNRDDLARMRNLMDDLLFQYNREIDNLEYLMEQKEVRLFELALDEAVLAEMLAVSEEEERLARSAFDQIQAQLRREINEQERQRQAQIYNDNVARLTNFNGQFQWPLPPAYHRVSSPYGMRVHPILGGNRMHTGIDVGAPTGTTIFAAAEGYVRFAGWSSGYGNTVIIDHGDNYSTLYAHASRNRVATGDYVSRGQHISDVGSTGLSTGPHLHFEIRRNNNHMDPMQFFQ